MGILERKERDREEMKQLIIDAAIHMFLEEGYEKTSIRSIAEKIEYSPATIYLYYKDKDELLHNVQREAFEKLDKAFRQKATAKDPIERLEQIMMTYIHFGKKNPELYDLMFIVQAPMNVVKEKELWRNGHESFGFLFQCISKCIEKKQIRYDDPMIASLSVWAMVHGLFSLDLRCRFKVIETDQKVIEAAIEKSIHEYLKLIKT